MFALIFFFIKRFLLNIKKTKIYWFWSIRTKADFAFVRMVFGLFLVLMLISNNLVFGQSAIASGDWDNPTIWNTSTVPIAGGSVSINGGFVVTIPAGYNAVAGSITIGSGSNLTLAGTSTLALSGNLNCNTNTGFTANIGSIVTINGSATQFSGDADFINFHHLVIDMTNTTDLINPPTIAPVKSYTINGNLTIAKGILDIGMHNFTVVGTTIIDNGGTFQDGTGGGINIFNALTINNSGKFIAINGGNKQFRFLGNIINNGTFDLDNTNNSSSGWQLGNASTPITVTNESNSVMFFSKGLNGSGSIVGDVIIENPTNPTAGNIELHGNGVPSGSGNITVAASKTLTNNLGDRNFPSGKRLIASPRNSGTGATFINNGVVEIGGGAGSEPIYNFDNSNSLVISRTNATITTTYNDLILTGSPVPSHALSGAIIISQNLKILAGNTLNASTHTINIGGNFENSGTFTSTGEVIFTGPNPQTIIGFTIFHNLTINKFLGQTVTMNNNIEVSNTLTLTQGLLLANFNEIQLTNGTFNNQLVGGNNSSYIVLGASGSSFSKFSRTNANITTTALFPVGAVVGDYTPISITSTGGYGSVSIYLRDEGVSTTATTPALLTPKVNRIWSLVTTNPTIGADIEIKWNASNELPSALPSTALLQQYAPPATTWSTPASNTFNGVTRTVTGTISPGASGINNDFAIFVPVSPVIVLSPVNSTLPNGVVNQSYTLPFGASGGTNPYTFSITSGSLPSGMTLSGSGVLSGFPTTTGTFNFTATATDAFSNVGSQSYTLTIIPDVQFVTTSSFNFTANTDNTFTLSALTSANLPVSFFSTNTNVATVSSNNILALQTNTSGEAEIRAFNLGDANFLPSDTVTVMKINQFGIINTFENDLEKQVIIYPNPTTNHIWIKNIANLVEIKDVILVNSLGQNIPTKMSELSNQWKIDLSNTPKGIFFIKIITNRGILQRKIINN